MREQSRLRKAEEIIELAMMFQNSFRGLCISDIQEHFECSRRSAERMKTLLFDMFPEKIEEVESNDRKKRWRFAKGTMNSLITFNADDFANLEYLKGLSHDENKKKHSEGLCDPRRRHAERRDVSGCKAGDSFCCADYSLRRGRRRIQV